MKALPLLVLTGALASVACNGGGNDSGAGLVDADVCGDVDGNGGDTGNVPNILGKWTTTFGTNIYDNETCDYAGYTLDDMRWIQGNMEIKGRVPDGLYAIFDNDEDTRFYGLEASTGGVVFSGSREHKGDTMYVGVGGLLYEQPLVDRNEIRGFGYLGIDLEPEDQVIDCWVQGDFLAKKSGL